MQEKKIFIKNKYDNKLCGILNELSEDKCMTIICHNNAYRDNEKPKVHYHFVPRYKEELKLIGKVYKDRHFGYNFWKWNLSKFKCQKDPFSEEDRLKIYEMMKKEFNIENVKLIK